MNKMLGTALLLTALCGALSEAASAANPAAGRAKATVLCENCHGADGVATLAGAANLSGQQREYVREQLRAFRAGSRQNPQMSIIAKMLTDDDIENLSSWYASIKVSVEMPK